MTPLFALLALVGANGQASASPPADGGRQTIVVTGVRLEEARRRLEDCLARHCPTLEDIGASLQYADALFANGDYRLASGTLRDAIGRNRGEAARYPVAVAGLYRARSRVASHEGEGETYRSAAYAATRALKAGLADDDPRVLAQQLETAGVSVSLGEVNAAERLYRDVARRAGAIGRPDIAATADLRRAWLYHLRQLPEARDLLAEVAARPGPAIRVQRYAARILLARIDRAAGETASSDALVAELATAGLGVPVLVYAPPIEIGDHGGPGTGGRADGNVRSMNVANMQASGAFGAWADIGFWVTAEGRVEDVETLRSHGDIYWLRPVLGSIAGRIYAPAGTDTAEPTYRIERYTYTARTETRTGSRIAARGAEGRIESIDLTADPSATRRPSAANP